MSELERRPDSLPATSPSADATTANDPVQHESFSVDTGLFRELGELLVGRDSTALVELIKNAYDADATKVTVVARNLGDAETGVIIISDDGNGMTIDEFRRGFLRVASRLKSGGDRRSPVYRRRFTGAKGIGRLAAHKLARDLSVESRAAETAVAHADSRRKVTESVQATIDWDEVERHEVLADVGDAIAVRARDVTDADQPGTTIRLAALRRPWSDRERTRFVREVSTFQPGAALRSPIAPEYIKRRLLFDVPHTRDAASPAEFNVMLGGEFDVGDDYSVDVLAAAAWIVEVDATDSEIRFAVAPTKTYARAEKLDPAAHTATLPRDDPGPTFQARIFVRTGAAPKGLGDAYGVRVYMEGFRVLPYGEPGDDWLDVNRRYASRGRAIEFSGNLDDDRLGDVTDREAGLVAVPLRNVFGGVFLTEAGAPQLRMLVNREGFVPDETFLEIADALGNALALQTRVSAALRPDRRADKRVGRLEEPAGPPVEQPTVHESLNVALEEVLAVSSHADASPVVRERLEHVADQLARAQEEVIDERTMLRVLASLGTQTAAFVHEINAALGSVSSLKRTVDQMLRRPPTPQEVASLQRRIDALQRTLERQSAYLVEIVSPDARRRRSRRRYADHFNIAALVLQEAADREGVTLRNNIPGDLKTPPMFPAEITSVFTNLLSNAIKAAGRDGVVEASGASASGRTESVVQNTGVAVDLNRAEQWFDPYHSTTAVVDPSLGQGMGLGLTITRAMLAEYRGTIQFVLPEPEFATAIKVSLPS